MKKNYFLMLICFLSFTGISLSQTTYYWRGEAISGNWEESTNWWNGSASTPSGADILRFNNNHETTMTNDLVATNRYQIFFEATATTSRTIGGTTENTFYDYGGNVPKIENNSVAIHTLNFPIKLGNNPTELNPVNGDLTFGGNIELTANYIDVYGDNSKTLTFNGVLSGTGGLSLKGNSKVIFNGENTFTGATNVNSGDLEINADMAGNIQVNNNATLQVNTDLTIPQLVLYNNATVTVKAGKSLTISGNLENNSSNAIILENGATLIVNGTSTGDISYNVNVTDDNWHLISSPVVGQVYGDTWANDNIVADGNGTNRGISTYQNGTPDGTTGPWVYMQDGASSTFDSGVGYSLKRTSSGTYAFTGTFPNGTITPAISTNTNDWNLIGNPYPSNLNIATFITENSTTNDFIADGFDAIYVWNPTEGGTGAYNELTTGFIQPGQAFFIKSKVDGAANITEAMQSHTTGTFYKNTDTSINLLLSNGKSTKRTKINYLGGKSTSLDAGFDIGMFDGVDSDLRIYTHLIENNKGIAFARQALPNTDLESLVIPVGVKAALNTEITFSAEALNLPTGIKVFLEDRNANTFTRLDEANSEYKVTLEEALNGIGRFYLHTSSKSTLNVTNIAIENISIYTADASTLKIVGLQEGNANVKIFNMLGKQMMNSSFKTNGAKEISLPQLATGVYFVQLTTETGKLNKKIVLE
ncbi:T9SS type A sorting domain-containing protein [Polaribacter sp. KT25b]|uniref:T9SS type A sorting domain-containing protein n=1 Tax=Polaribacter sp. KT25b TaxID=1855336 RepID=UPI001560BAFC|nr:T9SS type A sorting domain-containing protein [Polaribacter sp. KT25b]